MVNIVRYIILGVLLLLRTGAMAQSIGIQNKPAFLNQELSTEVRVADLMDRLTLEQKAQLLNHRGKTVEVAGFSIRADQWNQCLHGVKWTEPTTNFPISIALGATWDTELMHRVATVISDEARAIYNGWKQNPDFRGEHKGLIYRSPVINISRNPFWGRINEIFGEDPYHTGRMGVAYVKGIQGNDPHYLKLASTLKHYAVNNVETDRMKLNATVPERMLYEYWLPHFRACIVEGKAQSVMASYNAINGVPNNINKLLLTDILKKQWGHEGFVVSDLGGVRTMVEGHQQRQMSYEEAVGRSIMAGCDFSDAEYEKYIPEALRKGYLTEERLNDALRRVLRVRFRLGEFDDFKSVPYSGLSPEIIGCKEHRKLSLEAARKSIVLLKNDKNLLPVDKNNLKRIAVIGPYADLFNQGNYGGVPDHPVKPLQGIRNAVGTGVEVLYCKGAQITPVRVRKGWSVPPRFDKETELKKAVDMAKHSDIVFLFVGTTADIEVEGRDRKTLALPGNQEELIKSVYAVNKNVVVVLMSAGPLAVPAVKKHIPAILQAWWPGDEGGNAIADVLFGVYNPGAKLPYTMYASDSQVPSINEYDISKGFTYMYLEEKPLFAFGHGLSYSKFRYSDLHISSPVASVNDTVTVSLKVKNIGSRVGDEVVQLYVKDVKAKVIRPNKELRGFTRITLQPGEKQLVRLALPTMSLAFYDGSVRDFVVEPGSFSILLGSASDDIRLQTKLIVK